MPKKVTKVVPAKGRPKAPYFRTNKSCWNCLEGFTECKHLDGHYRAGAMARTYPELVVILYECPCDASVKYLHHPDYSQPYMVVRFCQNCHRSEHTRLRLTGEVL